MSHLPFKHSPVWVPIWMAGGSLGFAACIWGLGAAFFGPAVAWDILAGIASPTTEAAKAATPVAWAISISGYVVVPAVIGLIVAGFTDIAMKSRLAPLEQRLEEAKDILQPPAGVLPATGPTQEGTR